MTTKAQPQKKCLHLGNRRAIERQPQVKTVSIFINNLDMHIAESYDKLRKARFRSGGVGKWSADSQKFRIDENSYKESSTMLENVSKFMVNSVKKEEVELDSLLQGSKCQQNIALISNQQVNQYINLVYSMYNIPDPLEKLPSSEQILPIRDNKRRLSETPVMKKRESASELKNKIVLHRDIDLAPLDRTSTHRKEDSRFDFSLKSNRDKDKSLQYRSTARKSKNSDAIPQTIKLSGRRHKKSPSVSSEYWTPQVFRYCFACEQAVLQSNLRFHEGSCKLLQEALGKSLEEVVEMLDHKISRISREIESQFVDASNEKFLSGFRDLKRSVGEWIKDVRLICGKENSSSNSARKKMCEIQQNWGREISVHFDEMARLHWFSRLRENMRRLYGV